MNDRRIKDYVDEIFRGVAPSARVTEQKEELVVNITEQIQDYMRDGITFDTAFETAKGMIGDTSELTAPFKTAAPSPSYDYGSQTPPVPPAFSAYDGPRRGSRIKVSWGDYGLVALAPFAYVSIGLMQGWLGGVLPFGLFDVNWWAWGWILIPGSAILCTPMKWTTKFVSLSPFIYLLLGFWFGAWAFGWVIIPIAGIFEAGLIKVTRE